LHPHSFIRSVLTALAIALFFAAGAVSVSILIKWIATGRNLSSRTAGIGASLWATEQAHDFVSAHSFNFILRRHRLSARAYRVIR
jgi:hypothetical protein